RPRRKPELLRVEIVIVPAIRLESCLTAGDCEAECVREPVFDVAQKPEMHILDGIVERRLVAAESGVRGGKECEWIDMPEAAATVGGGRRVPVPGDEYVAPRLRDARLANHRRVAERHDRTEVNVLDHVVGARSLRSRL